MHLKKKKLWKILPACMMVILASSHVKTVSAQEYVNDMQSIVFEQKGWNYVNDIWYYAKADGNLATGWQYIRGHWYYMNANGEMQVGLQKIGNAMYYLQESGAMYDKGWYLLDDVWYYFNKNGDAKTGWLTLGKTKYYLDENGIMLTGEQEIEGIKYFFAESGALRQGWHYVDENWYYYEDSMDFVTGWKRISGTWYFMNEDGVMQTGWLQDGKHWYYLASSGAMQTGWQKIENKWHYMKSGGQWDSNISYTMQNVSKYVDVPYVSGGASPTGWDCSGFTQWIMAQMGVKLPKASVEQARVGTSISVSDKSQWKAGDLLFFAKGGRVGHVALYLGDGKMIHALNTKYDTYITDVNEYCKWDKKNVLTYVKRVM